MGEYADISLYDFPNDRSQTGIIGKIEKNETGITNVHFAYALDDDPQYNDRPLLIGSHHIHPADGTKQTFFNKCYLSFDLRRFRGLGQVTISNATLNIDNIQVIGNPQNFASRIDVKAHKFGFLDVNDFNDYSGTIIGSFQTSQITNGRNLTLQTAQLKDTLQQSINNCQIIIFGIR